jgi:tmRNA-binding protein
LGLKIELGTLAQNIMKEIIGVIDFLFFFKENIMKEKITICKP